MHKGLHSQQDDRDMQDSVIGRRGAEGGSIEPESCRTPRTPGAQVGYDGGMIAPHDTPVDTPAVVNAKKSKQQLAWEAQAAQLKADGYNASVVARKMIDDHGMPDEEAEQTVGELFGKKVNAQAGDTTSAIATGLFLLAAGLIGCAVLY